MIITHNHNHILIDMKDEINKKSPFLYTLVVMVKKECYWLPDHSEYSFHLNGGRKQKVRHQRLE